jgi:hypothetical protein
VVGFGSAAGVVLAAGIAWHVGQNALQPSPSDTFRGAPSVVPVQPISGARHKRERANEAQDAAAAATQMQAPPPAPTSTPPLPPAKPGLVRKAAPKPPAANAPQPPQLPAAMPAPPPAPFPAQVDKRADSAATGAAGAMKEPESAPVAAPSRASDALDQAMPRRPRSSAPPAPSGSVELRRDMQLPPDDWLAHIVELLHQGRRQQAVDSLRLFQRMHPRRQLPRELQALLD